MNAKRHRPGRKPKPEHQKKVKITVALSPQVYAWLCDHALPKPEMTGKAEPLGHVIDRIVQFMAAHPPPPLESE